jgi:hypothetical protein
MTMSKEFLREVGRARPWPVSPFATLEDDEAGEESRELLADIVSKLKLDSRPVDPNCTTLVTTHYGLQVCGPESTIAIIAKLGRGQREEQCIVISETECHRDKNIPLGQRSPQR